MEKKTSAIIGVNFQFRKGKKSDALRAWVFKDGKYTSIGAKNHATLYAINRHLKENCLRASTADADEQFVSLKQKFEHELRSKFDLVTYKAIQRLQMKTKDFNFDESLEKENAREIGRV